MSTFEEVVWHPITFTVPTLAVPVYTKVEGKRVKKKDDLGNIIYKDRIVPKGRPRLGKYGQTHTPETTTAFEKWIRNSFFQEYPGSYAVFYKGKPRPVDQYFIGCQRFTDNTPCVLFRNGSDFVECSNCPYRRKNLSLSLKVFFNDDKISDLDNIIKIVLDALNGVCFYDDSQFIFKEAKAYYNADVEKIDVTISKLETSFEEGCLRAGYVINKLPVREAMEYIKFIIKEKYVLEADYDSFLSYLNRCDKRTYVKDLNLEKLKEFL